MEESRSDGTTLRVRPVAHESGSRLGEAAAEVDDSTAGILAALASPVRLRILSALARPRIVTELRIPADRGEGSIAARQTVQAHLDKLEEAGLVQTVEVLRNGRPYRAYVARAETIRAAKAVLRRVADVLDGRGRSQDGTLLIEPEESPLTPHLLLVRGADHVATFDLPEPTPDMVARRWAIGRETGVDVCVTDDPFVSRINAYLEWTPEGYAIRDAMSANGTSVNGAKLASGARCVLRSGDIIGLGRSFLVFRAP